MEILVAHQTALKATVREISSSNFGMFQDMIDTKNAGLFSTLKLMVSSELPFFFEHPCLHFSTVHVKVE